MNEKWKPVSGYEGYYQVSNLGRVRNIKKRRGTRVGSILDARTNHGGYVIVGLRGESGEYKDHRVHVLVAQAFIGPKPVGLDVNHIDGNKENNKVSNLEYVTRSENLRHALLNGLTPRRIRANPNKVKATRILLADGTMTQKEIGEALDLGQTTISNIGSGKTWGYVD